jgi:YVTN family beta-propeller protein
MAVSATSEKENNRRFALIIAVSEYQDSDFQQLVAPGKDADALASVLKNPDIGGYDNVKVIKNEPAYKVNEEIQAFFNDRRRNDLLLLYFSCHGVKDEDGHLYYAAVNTRRKLLAATAISANFVNEIMARSRSRRQVLVADCCYSGAFGKGFVTRADKKIHTGEYFEQGRGRIVLTASDSMQYSFEEDKLQVEVDEPGSIFTRAIVEGLNTGKADLNEDGLVSYDELYDYTFERVIDETPNQRPQKWEFGVEGDVVIAKNPYKRKTQDPNELVQDAIEYLKKGESNATIEYSDKAIKLKPPSSAPSRATKFKNPKIFVPILSGIAIIVVGLSIVVIHPTPNTLPVHPTPNTLPVHPNQNTRPITTPAIPVGKSPRVVSVNPSTNMVYVANNDENTVSVIDGKTNNIITAFPVAFPVGKGPSGVSVNPSTNIIYVTNRDDNTVSVIDGKTNHITATIPVGDSPRDVSVNPSTNIVYVVNGDDTVSVIGPNRSFHLTSCSTHCLFPDHQLSFGDLKRFDDLKVGKGHAIRILP